MLFDLIGGSYLNKYPSLNPQRTINWYIHKQQIPTQNDKYQHSLQPFPGLSRFSSSSLGTNQRKIFVARTLDFERCFVIVDTTLYELFSDGTTSSLGTLSITNDITLVHMEVNSQDQVMILHSSASYIYQMGAETLTKITDSNFPANPTYLSYTQGYFIVTAGGRVYYSALLDGTTWPALNVFTPSASADATLAAVVWRDDIHCFSTETIEIYVNDGTSPFSKQGRDTMNIGLESVDSLKIFHDGIIFVGKMRKGQKKVYFYNGASCIPISNASIDWALNNPSTTNGTSWDKLLTYTWDMWFDEWGVADNQIYAELQYSKDGHIFYYLTHPSLHTTYTYDVLNQEWTERQSLNPLSQTQQEYRGIGMVNFLGTNLWIDKYTGYVMQEDWTVSTEDSQTITRTRISQVFANQKKNISIYGFELDMVTGVGLISSPSTTANITLYYSRDNGQSFSQGINLSTGVSGATTQRPRSLKLGTARDWVFKLVLTDTADLAIHAAFATGVIDTY